MSFVNPNPALEHLAQKDKLELNQMNKNQVTKEEAGVMKIEPAKFKMKTLVQPDIDKV